jgi:prepilin-type N-terminal cleavage/methylation domain-containing protein
MKRSKGFSVVELLVSMGILGVLLTLLGSFLVSNQRITSEQITAATLENETRLAFLRMSEVISQAQYIFPEGQTLIISDQTFTIGANAIAVLIPGNTTYCRDSDPGTYCGFAFTVESRTPFTTVLGSGDGTSGFALIETRVLHLEWKRGLVPAQQADLFTWKTYGRPTDYRRSPITDSIDTANTDLFTSTKLASFVDFDVTFNTVDINASNALLNAVESKIYLRRTVRGKTLSIERSNYVFSRAIPRSMLPN